MRKTITNCSFWTLITILVLVIGARAQSTSSAISGFVSDPNGAVIQNAAISLRGVDTDLKRGALTDANGHYRIVGLSPGRYEVRAEHKGFETRVQSEITLTLSSETRIDISLAPKGIQEAVIIDRASEDVHTNNSTINSLIDDRQIRHLPLNGRDLSQLFLLQPGVANSRSSMQSANAGRGTRFSVAGARPNQNVFTLDGTIINDALNNTPGSAQGLLIGTDAIQEVRILASGYGAEHSRAAGGVFLAVTKSGTNEYHGSFFEFIRDGVLDARNFFDRQKPDFYRHQFGFSLSGPIVKGRTFYFGNYEGLRERKEITRASIVPDDNARAGILPNSLPVPVDPRSEPIIDLFPRANGKSFGDGTAEFSGITKRISNDDYLNLRIDHNYLRTGSLFVRYLFDNSDQILPHNFPQFPNRALNNKQVITIEERRVIQRDIVNEARFGFSRSAPTETIAKDSPDPFSIIKGRSLGEISVGGLSEIGTDRTNPKVFRQDDFQFTDNLYFSKGLHNVQTGLSFQHFRISGRSESRVRGQLRFRSLADLLAFRVRDLQASTPDTDFGRRIRQSLFAVYVQDSARVDRRLTFNVGIRYEIVTTPTEADGKLSNMRDVLDSRVTVGNPFFRPSRNNFAPRLGFAFDVFGDGKTAARGGFGIYYEQPLFNVFLNSIFRSLPFENRGTLPGSRVSSLPVDPSLFTGIEQDSRLFQFKLRPTYLVHYNLDIQKEMFPSTVMTFAYLGSRGVNLFGQGDLNIAIPQRLADGRDFFPEGSQPRNSFFGRIRGIFQGFNSHYHALNVGLVRRLSGGFGLQGFYTFGKSIDERSGALGRQEYTNGQLLTFDPFNRRLDRARSDFDIRHTFVANATFEMPNKQPKGLGKIVANWRLSAIITFTSGLPINPFIDGDPDRDGSDQNEARPNLIPNVSLIPPGGRTPDRWFNLSAFAPPEIGFRGTAGRNIATGPDYQSIDIAVSRDFRLTEKAHLEFRVEIFNLFNRPNFDLPANTEDGEQIFIFSQASGGRPASFTLSPTAGKIFRTAGDSREVQLALKLTF